MTEIVLLGLALALTVTCGLFVAAEFSLTTVERSTVEEAAAARRRGARSAREAVRTLSFQLSGAQLGITMTSLVIGMLAEPSIAALLAGPLRAAGTPEGAVRSVALALGTVLSTVVLMVFGELVPKNWAISAPLPVALRVAPVQRRFSLLFRPLIRHLNDSANRVLRRAGMEPVEELAPARSAQELAATARHSAREGALEADTAELFVRMLRLSEFTAQHIMTPRVLVAALESGATAEDAAAATRATGLSRFPVYRETLDTVIGTVHLKDVLAVPAGRREEVPVTRLLREPLLVPGAFTCDRLLDRLSESRGMAVVVDEYGGTAGETDVAEQDQELVPVKLGVWLSNIRSRRGSLTPERAAALNELGIRWE